MNKGINKTEAKLKDTIEKMEAFHSQMAFRKYMSEKYCLVVYPDRKLESPTKNYYNISKLDRQGLKEKKEYD